MLPALVKYEEFEKRVPRVISGDADVLRAQAALQDASTLVRDESGQDWLDEEGVPNAPDALQRIVLAVAKRDFLERVRSVTDTAGPFTHTESRSDEEVSAYLTEKEAEICQRYRPAGTSGLWTQPVTRNEYANTTMFWNDQFGTEPFPLGSWDRWWE